MEKEIKEILEALKPHDKEFAKASIKEYSLVLSVKEQKTLLNYITNLQEKVEYYEGFEINKTIDKIRLQNNREYKEVITQLEDYKSRNEKAVEYINKNKHLSMFADCREPEQDWNYDLEINPRELLNILNGGENNVKD